MKKLHMLTFILLVIGGLNWLLAGIFGKDIFVILGMEMRSTIPVIVYILVGLSAVNELIIHKKICKLCSASVAQPSSALPHAGSGM